jgi:hypothetical protein
MLKKYDAEEINDINEDILDSLNSDEVEIEQGTQGKQGMFKGYIKVTVEYIHPNDCECVGFEHDRDCHNWVMSF